MALDRPTRAELRQLARDNHFDLSEEEEEAYAELFVEFLPRFDELDAMPEPRPVSRYPERDPGTRPAPEDDPYNAIVRRCLVRGVGEGPLAGKRIGLKDNVSIAGIPMTCGSTIVSFVPDRDATIVTRLLDAGADIVAVVNMDSFAYSGAGDTSAYGPTRNPHDASRLAGGSSGGSAAALGYDDIDITIGADQGGSIRIPAAWCGVVGLKPTHGLVPYTGIAGIDLTYDHAGPLARTVPEVALALDVLAGRDPLDPRQYEVAPENYTAALERELTGIRVGLVREGFGHADAEPDVEAAVRSSVDALRELGAAVTEIDIPAHRTAGPIIWGLFAEAVAATLQSNGIGYHWRGAYDPAMAVAFGEGLQVRAGELPPQGKIEVMLGTFLRQRYHGRFYAKAQNLRRDLRAAYDAALREVDVLTMPTTPMKAHPYEPELGLKERVLKGWNMLGNTAPFNMTGHPSLSVPCARSERLPIGLMLTGRHFEDGTVLAVAHGLERLRDWRSAGV